MASLDDELRELGGSVSEALDTIHVPAILLDGDGRIRWQNRASTDFRGNRVGEDFADLVWPQEQPEARDLIRRILCRGEPAELTLQVLDAHHTYVPVQVSAVPVRDGGSVVAVFGLGYRLPTPPGAREAAAVRHLTERQLDVLRLLAEGSSTDEIARELSLSPTTVRNHVAGLLAALGVHSRLQAVLQAKRLGLVDR